MRRSSVIWLLLMIIGGGFLLIRVTSSEMGKAYVRAVEVAPEGSDVRWTKYVNEDPKFRNEPDVSLSWPRTIGLWVAALCTLGILSFLYGDNPFFKISEAVFIGSSAAYLMVVGFWTGIVQNLIGKLSPALVQATVLPNYDQQQELIYVIPLILSVMMLWRLSPVGGWIARWPLAFFIGATAGVRLVGFLDADFIKQIQNTIIPLYVVAADGSVDYFAILKNLTIVIGVLACLVYFFFSIEHTGAVGRVAKLGIWFLMVTFGAGFGYTVMGRIALLAIRLEFLFDDWLWIIDPAQKRLGM